MSSNYDTNAVPNSDLTTMYGVGDARAQKLRNAGMTHVSNVAEANVSELAERADLGEETARHLKQRARTEVGELDRFVADPNEMVAPSDDVVQLAFFSPHLEPRDAERLRRLGLETVRDLVDVDLADVDEEYGDRSVQTVRTAVEEARIRVTADAWFPACVTDDESQVLLVAVPEPVLEWGEPYARGAVADSVRDFAAEYWTPDTIVAVAQHDSAEVVRSYAMDRQERMSPLDAPAFAELDGAFDRIPFEADSNDVPWADVFDARDQALRQHVDGCCLVGMSADVGEFWNLFKTEPDIDLWFNEEYTQDED